MTVGLVAVQLLLTSVLLSESYYVVPSSYDHTHLIIDEAPGVLSFSTKKINT